MSDDWFRRTTWSPGDSAAFQARLARSRSASNRAQYLRIQAVTLAAVGTPAMMRAALALLEQLFTEVPEPLQLAPAWHLRAQCLSALGAVDEALYAYDACFNAQRALPTVRTTAHGDYAELVTMLRRRDRYSDVLACLDEFGTEELFPAQRYQQAASRALIAAETGDAVAASAYARAALAETARVEPPFPRHRDLGLVRSVDPERQARLQALATGLA